MYLFFTLLYLATVALSVAVAYDPALAWKPGALLTVGALAALGVAVAGRRWKGRSLAVFGAGCALLAAAVGGYFLLRYDWLAAGEGKFAAIQQAGLWVQEHRPAVSLPEDINGNVAGAALALLLPPGIAAAAHAWGLQRPSGVVAALLLAPCLAVGAAALVLTSSRGAWLATVAGGAAAAAVGAAARWHPRRFKAVALSLAAGLFLAALGLTAAVVAWPGADGLLGEVTGAGNSVLSRAQLWRDGLALIGDYLFTGSGAGTSMMVYSSYAMLLHVGYISHAHNLFLHIALEQGLPGLVAFLGLVALGWAAIAARGSGREDGWRAAAAAALAALMVHGIADAGIYTSYLAPVAFVPVGLALGLSRPAGEVPATGPAPAANPGRRTAATLLTLAVVLAAALLPPVRSAFQANLAALAQTRAELSVYRWPTYPVQDALRRQLPGYPPPADLEPAIARYRAALALDPGNVTANRRLGQIELSLGAYDAARDHLEAAYAAAPWQRPARALLAEAYTVTGRPDLAAPLWASADMRQGQLALRQWWYGALGEEW